MAMAMKALAAWLRDRARRFIGARDGNIAVIFALASLPIVGLIGASVDYSRANAVKADLQSALDATALMVSKSATTESADQLQKSAQAYFDALFNHPEAQGTTITASYNATGGSTVTVGGETAIKSDFIGIIGFPELHINSSSTVAWGSSRLRVALVLDNTGSMAQDGKMDALKTATKNLLAQLKAAASTDGDVYVSIIPFSKDVNVGSQNYNGNWIDWSDWEDANGKWQSTSSCSAGYGHSRHGQSHCNNTQTWVAANHSTWNGCITDRDQDYDQNVTAANPADASLPGGQASTLFPAEQYNSCPVAMMGLNYDWTSMNSLVTSMQPNGNTNQPIGLVWGWQSLAGGGPLNAPTMDSNYEYKQIIILLSDGLNTQDRWYSSQTPVDNRMYQTGNGTGTCANIKAAGITLYTIQVDTGNDPTSTLLQNCASDSSKFFLLKSANQIVTTFNTIGTNLSQLRLAK
jgi:Flp pilus assembly protein TadG